MVAARLTIFIFLPLLVGCSLGPNTSIARTPQAPAASADVATVKTELAAFSSRIGQMETAIEASLSVQNQADEMTGINVDSAMPVGLGALLAWQSWLSHRREMVRIKQNGKS